MFSKLTGRRKADGGGTSNKDKDSHSVRDERDHREAAVPVSQAEKQDKSQDQIGGWPPISSGRAGHRSQIHLDHSLSTHNQIFNQSYPPQTPPSSNSESDSDSNSNSDSQHHQHHQHHHQPNLNLNHNLNFILDHGDLSLEDCLANNSFLHTPSSSSTPTQTPATLPDLSHPLSQLSHPSSSSLSLHHPSSLAIPSLPIISHQAPSPVPRSPPSSHSLPSLEHSSDAKQHPSPATPRQLPPNQPVPAFSRHRSASNLTADSSAPPSHRSRDSYSSSRPPSGPPPISPPSNPSTYSNSNNPPGSSTSLSSSHNKHPKRKHKPRPHSSATALALSGVALLASPAPLGWSDPMSSPAPAPTDDRDDRSVLTADERSGARSRAPSQLDDSLGTGYAVASRKRNADFHAIFKSIPEDDYLIEDYGCALQRDILVQGRLYISEQHLCFKANIFGWVTTLVIPFYEVATIEKRMTALIIPNAIQVATMHSRHTFASFLARDATFDLLTSIWRIAHPTVPAASMPSSQPLSSHDGQSGASPPSDGGAGDGVHVEYTGEAPGGASQRAEHAPTQCACLGTDEHYKELVWEAEYPVSPEKLYGILFQSEFVRQFWVEHEHLTEIEVSEWTKGPNALLPTRTISYVRPLTAAMGPKMLRCLIAEEHRALDFDTYVSLVTTTRTPDAPTGGSFCVKTSTCVMWGENNRARMIVTGGVEWSKVNRFLKSIIENSAIGGQKTYHQELDKALRQHISQTQPDMDSDRALTTSGSSGGDAGPAAVHGPPSTARSKPTPAPARVVEARREAASGLSWRMMVAVGVAVVLLLVNVLSLGRSGGAGNVVIGPSAREELTREVAGTVREALEAYFKDTHERDVGRKRKERASVGDEVPLGQVLKEWRVAGRGRSEEVAEIEAVLEVIERRIRSVRRSIVEEKKNRGGLGGSEEEWERQGELREKQQEWCRSCSGGGGGGKFCKSEKGLDDYLVEGNGLSESSGINNHKHNHKKKHQQEYQQHQQQQQRVEQEEEQEGNRNRKNEL